MSPPFTSTRIETSWWTSAKLGPPCYRLLDFGKCPHHQLCAAQSHRMLCPWRRPHKCELTEKFVGLINVQNHLTSSCSSSVNFSLYQTVCPPSRYSVIPEVYPAC